MLTMQDAPNLTEKARTQVPRRPNYGQERAERQRKKAARRDERLAAKAERREKIRPSDSKLGDSTGPVAAGSAAERSGAPIPADADAAAMRRLAQALAFVCGPDHPATLALQRAAQSGAADDVERARAMFQQLADRDQRVALAIAAAAAPPPA
jgi:hypothetical protein